MSGGAVTGLSTARPFRRVLVALDWSSENASAAEVVAALAQRLRAELRAMFVEDIDLLRLTEHPHVYAFSMLSASGEHLAAEQLQRVLRSRLARSRRAIEEAASRRHLKCVFEVRQGRLLVEALNAACNEDLVIVSWSGRGGASSWVASHLPTVAFARALAEAEASSVLLLHPNAPASGPILVAYDGSAAAKAALVSALQVTDDESGTIEIALLSGRADEAKEWANEIARGFPGNHARLKFLHLPNAGLEEFCRLAARQQARLVVMVPDLVFFEREAGCRALERIDCSVLLVR